MSTKNLPENSRAASPYSFAPLRLGVRFNFTPRRKGAKKIFQIGSKVRALVALALALAAASSVPPVAPGRASSAHKFHTSFTEANYNAEAGTLEITLRTFPDDIDAALKRRAARRAPGAKPPDAGGARRPEPKGAKRAKEAGGAKGEADARKAWEEALAAYVAETFQLRTARGEPIRLNWIGADAGADSAWLYFEARLPEGVEGVSLLNTFLADLHEDQVNLVTVRAGPRKGALRFERGAHKFQTVTLD